MQAIGSKQWAHDLVREYEAGPRHRTRGMEAYRMAYRALNRTMPDPDAQVCSGAPAPARPVPVPQQPSQKHWQDD